MALNDRPANLAVAPIL